MPVVSRHYLRFDGASETAQTPAVTPLRVEGTIHHPASGEPWEYTIVVTIRNSRGEEIARKLVGVARSPPASSARSRWRVEAVEARTRRPGKGGR
jgi:hypothetical protein